MMARKYKYAVESYQVPRPVVIEATNLNDAASRFVRTFPKQTVKRVYKVVWEAPAKPVGRKHEGQAEAEQEAYDNAVKELVNG